MKVKLAEIQNMVEGMNSIVEEKLPAKAAYWLARNAVKLQKELETFEEVRKKSIEKYCKKDKEGKPIIDEKNNQYKMVDVTGFQTEFAKLIQEEIEVDLKTVKLSDLGEDTKLKTVDLIKLEKIIVE